MPRTRAAAVTSGLRFVDAMPDPALVVGSNGLIIHVNDAACSLFGLTTSELVGSPVETLIPEAKRARHEQSRAGYSQAPHPRRMGENRRLFARHKSGRNVPVDVMLSPMSLDGDEVVIASVRDMSARHALEAALAESEARLRTIIETEPECVKLLSETGTLLEMNAAGLRMIEADSLDAVRGADLYALVDPAHRKAMRDLTAAVFAGRSQILEFKIRGLRGGERWLETHATPLRDRDGKVTALLGVTRDITAHRQAAERLARLNRTHTLLSLTNQLIVRVQNERELFDGISRIAVERGGFLHAWVSMGDARDLSNGASTDTVPPAAELGASSPLSILERGCPVAAWALASGGAEVLNDLVGRDADSSRWALSAGSIGCGSIASFPLYRHSHAVGALNLCSRVAGFFQLDERELLDQLAIDVSFALDALDSARARERAELRQRQLTTVLESVALDRPLPALLDELTRTVDRLSEGMRSSVLLLDETGRLRLGAASALPAAYNEAIDGLAIGAAVGSCGTAAFAKRLVVVEDVRTDPLWEQFRELARAHDLRACWSQPILDASGTVLGTLALYHTEPRGPAEDELELIRMAAHIAGIAIEKDRSKRALQSSEDRLAELAETIDDVFWVTDSRNSRILYVSRAYELKWGFSREQLVARPRSWMDAVVPEDRSRLERWFRTLDPATQFDETFRIRRADGEERWIRLLGYPVSSPDRRVERVVGVARDITDRRLLEEQVSRVQRIEATGQLAAGVAHDFNNILTVILAGAELAEQSLPEASAAIRDLRQIAEAARRGAALTQQLLGFTRQQAIRPKIIALNAQLEILVGMLRRTIPESIAISIAHADSSWLIHMDPAQVDQVVLNLVMNARDAMPEGGTVRVEIADVVLDSAFCAPRRGLSPGEYVRLTVADNGHGMDPETLEHAFEPFYTTKPLGQGTGLGLASVYGIVKQNRGYVELRSVVGGGTVVTIHFPRTSGEPSARRLTPVQVQGAGDIVIVEDDASVREVMLRYLRALGYTVRAFAEPEGALDWIRTTETPFDVLLTDVVMPKMSGIDLSSAVKAIRPSVRVIFISGYAPENVLGVGRTLPQHAHFVSKPFDLGALATAVSRAMAGRTEPVHGVGS